MTFRPNTRRIFDSWARAAQVAGWWAQQTGWKYRISKIRDGYRVAKLDRRCNWYQPLRRP